MFLQALACCFVSALATLAVREAIARRSRRSDEDRTRELSVELALHVAERSPLEGDLRVPRRMVERILVLSRALNAAPEDARSAALAAALPPGARADTRLPLPDATRGALACRFATFDGTGLPNDVLGHAIPLPAQLLAAVDWLEARDGASATALRDAIRAEANRRFSPRMCHAIVQNMDELLSVASADAHLGLRVTNGAMLCIAPRDPEGLPASLRPALLASLEMRVRERLRPSDRVYCTDAEVVVWLGNTPAEGAMRAAARLEPFISRVPVPSIQRVEVACCIGVAVADTDATSFTELLHTARTRAQRVAAAA